MALPSFVPELELDVVDCNCFNFGGTGGDLWTSSTEVWTELNLVELVVAEPEVDSQRFKYSHDDELDDLETNLDMIDDPIDCCFLFWLI